MNMEIINFFKSLNNKINTYDKIIKQTNPFQAIKPVTVIWVEEICSDDEKNKY